MSPAVAARRSRLEKAAVLIFHEEQKSRVTFVCLFLAQRPEFGVVGLDQFEPVNPLKCPTKFNLTSFYKHFQCFQVCNKQVKVKTPSLHVQKEL